MHSTEAADLPVLACSATTKVLSLQLKPSSLQRCVGLCLCETTEFCSLSQPAAGCQKLGKSQYAGTCADQSPGLSNKQQTAHSMQQSVFPD